ncbi:MAG TPA: hypothetical protein VLQ91_17285 [Draconibacterium sp.]|nr:hypothetical protein [Draconibacterium sp.]
MKTTMKQLATGTFIALILLVLNVKAEGTEKSASVNESIENTLQLENWMIDETMWTANFISCEELAHETEISMKIESWMTNEETWNLNSNFIEETEATMELEAWMTGEKVWNTNDINNDIALTLENWMIDSNTWE